jgi:hypothetical protein
VSDADGWLKEQLKPLSMFELAKWWADAIKVIGAGNGAGLFLQREPPSARFMNIRVRLFP